MKFLRSEGRVVCLVEKQDITESFIPTGRTLPQIDLLLVPAHHQTEIAASHVWAPLLEAIGSRTHNIIYW